MGNETKRPQTIEELETKYAKMMAECERVHQNIEQMKKEEADRKRVQLALEKEQRKRTIEEKEKELTNLIHEYIKDYGSYETRNLNVRNEDVFPYLRHLFF